MRRLGGGRRRDALPLRVRVGRLGQDEHLSPRYVWMSSKETDSYTSRPETFVEGAGHGAQDGDGRVPQLRRGHGGVLPFHVATKMYTGNENAFFAATAQRRVLSYFNLRKDPDQWRAWLAGHGPILAGLSVDATWDGATATHGNLDTFNPSTVRGGHAIAVVGYLANGRFIIRNSWGTSWGDGGFAYALARLHRRRVLRRVVRRDRLTGAVSYASH